MAGLDIVGLGTMDMDLIYRTRTNLIEGEDVVDGFGQFPGGSAANTVVGLARLGLKAGLLGAIGQDAEGLALLDDLRKQQVDVSLIKVKDEARTGSALCLSDRSGKRALYFSPGANAALQQEDINFEYVREAKRLHVTAFPSETQFDILINTLNKLGKHTRVSLVPGHLYASKSLKVLTPLLEKTHLLFMNRLEIEQLTGTSYLKGARELIRRGCEVVVVTFDSGFAVTPRKTITAYVRNENNEWEVEPINLPWQPQAETTGSRDALAAGYIFGEIIGKKPGECAILGDLLARMSMSRMGARPGLPTRSEFEDKYRNLTGKPL